LKSLAQIQIQMHTYRYRFRYKYKLQAVACRLSFMSKILRLARSVASGRDGRCRGKLIEREREREGKCLLLGKCFTQ